MRNLLFLLLMPVILLSQVDSTNGIPVRQGNHVEWSRGAIATEDGDMIAVWSDTRYGDRDLFLQKISATGDFLWGENGTPIIRAANRQEDPVPVTDGKSGVIVAWVDYEQDSTGDIRAAGIDKFGLVNWVADICLQPGKQISIRMADDGKGGVYISWIDYRNTTDGDIYISHVDSNGAIAPGWGTSGIPVCSASGVQEGHTIDKDGSGGVFIAWTDYRSASEAAVYMQRFTENAGVHFQENGIAVNSVSGEKINPKIAFSADYGITITWIDKRNDISGDLYAQKFDTLGNPLWNTDGVPVCTASQPQLNPRIASDHNGGCIISWEDYRNGGIQADLYAQRISSSGMTLWGTDGLLICDAPGDQVESRLSTDTSAVYLIWVDERNGGYPHQDIYGQAVDYDGNLLWDTNGKAVCQAEYYQFSPLFRPCIDGVLAVWGDMRKGSPYIMIQKISPEGSDMLEADGRVMLSGIDGDAQNPVILTDYSLSGEKDFYVFWEDDRKGISGTRIYAQKILDNLSPAWEPNGIPVSGAVNAVQKNLSAVFNGNDLFCAWVEDRSGMQSVFMQKISGEGELLWGENAFSISDAIDVNNLRLGTFPNGDILVCWSDYNTDFYYQIFLQRIHPDSGLVWEEPGVGISSTGNDVYFEDMCIIDSTIIVLWRSGNWSDQNLFASVVSSSGEILNPEIVICDTTGFQQNARLSQNGTEAWLAWEDYRSGSADIYLQVLLPDGTLLLPRQGYPIVDAENDQSGFSIDAGYVTGEKQLTIAWQDFRNGSDYDIFYQVLQINPPFLEYGTEPTLLFTENGISLEQNSSNQSNPSCLRYGPVVWEDLRNGITSDLYYTYPRLDGAVLPLCTAENKQINPLMLEFETGGNISDTAVVLWEDKRSSGKTELLNLYFKLIDRGTIPQAIKPDSDPLPDSYRIVSAYPNPFNSRLTLEYRTNSTGKVEFIIFDLSGRIVKNIQIPVENGIVRYLWDGVSEDGKPLPSGEYFIRVKDADFSSVSRVVLLK